MNTRIILKSNDVSEAQPLLEDLVYGEAALNTRDAELYFRRQDDVIKRMGISDAVELKMGTSTTINDSTTGTQFSNFITPASINTDEELFTAYANGVEVERSGVYLVLYNLVFNTGGNNRRILAEITVDGTPVGGGNASPVFNNGVVGVSGGSLIYAESGERIGIRTTRIRNTGTMTTVSGAGALNILRVGV